MDLFEHLEDRRLLSASAVAELAQEGGVAELARSEPGAVARLNHRPASPGMKVARRPDNGGGEENQPTNPVAALATTDGGAAVSELARSEPGAVAELVRQDDGENGDNGNGDNGDNGDNGNGDGGQGAPTNPVAVLATTEGGEAVSELAQSEPGAVAALVRSGTGGDDDDDDDNGDDNGDGNGAPANPVADLAVNEGGSAVSELARGEAGAVRDLLQ